MSFADGKDFENLEILDKIISEDTVNKDNSWYPYIYKEFKCTKCGVDSGYYYKKWLGIFSSVSDNYTCGCCNTVENEE